MPTTPLSTLKARLPSLKERLRAMAATKVGRRADAEAWMLANPDAMEVFERLALQAAKAKRMFGIGFLAERVRWEYTIERRHTGFKINNNFRPYTARELIRRHPVLKDFIELRTVRY